MAKDGHTKTAYPPILKNVSTLSIGTIKSYCILRVTDQSIIYRLSTKNARNNDNYASQCRDGRRPAIYPAIYSFAEF